jgi:hypothetical protein
VTVGRRKAFRIATIGLLLLSLVFHLFLIGVEWYQFDSRLSCDRMLSRKEWFDCMTGESHTHIRLMIMSLSVWLLAGVGMLLGRYTAMLVSAVVIASWIAGIGWFLAYHWQQSFVPYLPFGEATPEAIYRFAIIGLGAAAFFIGPVLLSWLTGVRLRADRSLMRVSIKSQLDAFE